MTRLVANFLHKGGRKSFQTSGTSGLGRDSLQRATLDASRALASPPQPKDYAKAGLADAASPEAISLAGLGNSLRPL